MTTGKTIALTRWTFVGKVMSLLFNMLPKLDSSVGKESACNAGDSSLIPGLGRFAREGIGYSPKYSWASLVAQLVKNPTAMQETWVGKIPWRRERLPTLVFWPREYHGLYIVHGVAKSQT